jgi:hypothetical protein
MGKPTENPFLLETTVLETRNVALDRLAGRRGAFYTWPLSGWWAVAGPSQRILCDQKD